MRLFLNDVIFGAIIVGYCTAALLYVALTGRKRSDDDKA